MDQQAGRGPAAPRAGPGRRRRGASAIGQSPAGRRPARTRRTPSGRSRSGPSAAGSSRTVSPTRPRHGQLAAAGQDRPAPPPPSTAPRRGSRRSTATAQPRCRRGLAGPAHLEPDRAHVPRDAAVDRQVHREPPGRTRPPRSRAAPGRTANHAPSLDLEDLRQQLLLAQPRPLVFGHDPIEERRRQVAPGCRTSCPGLIAVVGSSTRSVTSRTGLGVVVTQSRGSSPSRRPNSRFPSAAGYRNAASSSIQAQSCCGPAQPLGLVGREGRGHAPVGPGQPAPRRLVPRPVPGRADRQDAALALDHRVPDVGRRRAHQGDPTAPPVSTRCADPLRRDRVLPAPRPIRISQVRHSPAGGRWMARRAGCSRHSPGGSPHGHRRRTSRRARPRRIGRGPSPAAPQAPSASPAPCASSPRVNVPRSASRCASTSS